MQFEDRSSSGALNRKKQKILAGFTPYNLPQKSIDSSTYTAIKQGQQTVIRTPSKFCGGEVIRNDPGCCPCPIKPEVSWSCYYPDSYPPDTNFAYSVNWNDFDSAGYEIITNELVSYISKQSAIVNVKYADISTPSPLIITVVGLSSSCAASVTVLPC